MDRAQYRQTALCVVLIVIIATTYGWLAAVALDAARTLRDGEPNVADAAGVRLVFLGASAAVAVVGVVTVRLARRRWARAVPQLSPFEPDDWWDAEVDGPYWLAVGAN